VQQIKRSHLPCGKSEAWGDQLKCVWDHSNGKWKRREKDPFTLQHSPEEDIKKIVVAWEVMIFLSVRKYTSGQDRILERN
jgi:hypothetical protein